MHEHASSEPPELRAPPHSVAGLHRIVPRLAAPLALAGLATPVLSIIETAIVGHLRESYYLGAVALGTLVFNYVYWAFSFLRIGSTGLTAQAAGAGRHDEVTATLLRAGLIALAVGACLVALADPAASLAFSLLEASPEVERHARAYVGIRLYGVPAALVSYAVLGFLTGLARARLAMGLELFRGAVNAVLALVLVRGMGRGVAGVAIASVAADWIAVAVGVGIATRFAKGPVRARDVLDAAAYKRLLGLNLDLFIRTQCLLFVFASFAAGGARLGDATLAANAVLMNLFMLVAYALGGFSQVASALVGEAVGARDARRVEAAVRATTAWAVGVAVTSAIAIVTCGSWFVDHLTSVAEVRASAKVFLPYAAALAVASVLAYQLDGVSVGATSTAALRNTLIAALAAFLGASRALVPSLGNQGLWLSFATFMAVRSVGFGLAVRSLRRAPFARAAVGETSAASSTGEPGPAGASSAAGASGAPSAPSAMSNEDDERRVAALAMTRGRDAQSPTS